MARLEGLVAAVSRGHDNVGRGIVATYERAGAEVVVGERAEGDSRRAAESVVDAALERYGRVDVLVLVAATDGPRAPIAEMADDHWTGAVDATLNHAFWGIRRGLQHMIPRKQGRILVVSTVAAKLPVPGGAAVAASEHAVGGLVKSAAHEVGMLGIKVNAILSGVLDERASNGNDETGAAFLERSALKRPNSLNDVANVAVLLASPSITSVTGCLFPVDGGTMPY